MEFLGDIGVVRHALLVAPADDNGPGAGNALNPSILISAGVATFAATVISVISIILQLKNYRKPILQRMTVRIMVMVPLYAISSLISLFSLDAAFAIDAIRDVYEAFVIYAFFQLMINYLGGERSLLILLHGRPPKHHVLPVSLFVQELDASDPFTFLFLKRGILQYVQVKPILAIATLILKATGAYKEGKLSWSSGYLYVSFIYNISICLSLYCLAMFWLCVNADIKPFRSMPKFFCVKGILFFSFWQALGISTLVAVGAIQKIGPYTDEEHISLAITDTLICLEMPFFAFAHWFAFSHTDYIDEHLKYAARMPFYFAFRDAFGFLDVLEDSRATLRGGVSYRAFEPVEGGMHQGIGRDRRIRAGLRYSKGGQKKYWIPMPHENAGPRAGPVQTAIGDLNRDHRGYALLLNDQDHEQFHEARTPPDTDYNEAADGAVIDDWAHQLEFEGPDPEIEKLFEESRGFIFGDYNYPCIDVSGEEARRRMWDEEERILKDQRAAFSLARDASQSLLRTNIPGVGRYGATFGSDLRVHSDPDSQAARSALKQHKGKNIDLDQPRSSPIVPKVGESIIDLTPHEPVPGADPAEGDITMIYTKSRKKNASTTRKLPRSDQASAVPHPSSINPSTALPSPASPANRRPTVKHTQPETRTPSSSSPRPDAIDLVVEDKEAAEEAKTRQRRKGEPAVRQRGERKVYRRTYVIQEPSGVEDHQIQAEQEGSDPSPSKGDELRVEGAEVQTINSQKELPSLQQTREQGNTVDPSVNPHATNVVTPFELTRSVTPPRVEVHPPSLSYLRDEDVESNPWA
ncbi:organic solute transporter Ostalpha-domain-containing protein [Cantharellus anzutake]|uniref:organic solute transporter Ostalpha-domain-containing protein n=1 Tax=Cantharellus anzutake TaxID=1750568 RepID=UPI001907A2AD|nr:organic solute transporter Ostalpha-domain-containing protein [Cantharellus anzutake]KAF8331318.1 organic solute transporter Ostalpha-domain-containing protein [Cantharellus anzutake]